MSTKHHYNTEVLWRQDMDHYIHPWTDFSTFKEEGSLVMAESEGAYVVDSEGNRYIDGIGGLWCVNIGYANEEMAQAIAEQVRRITYYSSFGHLTTPPAAELAAKLAQLTPGKLNHVFYGTGGSMSNDTAFRIIHYYFNRLGKKNKKKIISRTDGYHGSTYVAASLTGIAATKYELDTIGDEWISHVSSADMYRRPIGAETLSEPDYAAFLCKELENHILELGPENVAAFIAEPVMGAGGVLVAPQGYQRGVAEVCRKYDVLLVADEVVTGFGRLGEWVACEAVFGFVPDVLILAKGINSGYIPLGAAIFSSEIYRVISQPQVEGGVFSMGFTYSGHALACAAALKNIEIIESEDVLGNVRNLAPYFQSEARKLLDLAMVGDVRGEGFMLGIDLVEDKSTKAPFDVAHRIYQRCLHYGVIVRPIGHVVVISPPLIIKKAEIDELFNALELSIKDVVADKG